MTGELGLDEPIITFAWVCPACYFRHEWSWEASSMPEIGGQIWMQCEDRCGLESDMLWSGARFIAIGPSRTPRVP